MKRGIIKTGLLMVFLALPFVSADIFIDELRSLYNVGDVINANISLSSSTGSSGFLSASLICGVNEIEFYKSMEFLAAREEKRVPIKVVVENSIIGPLDKECYIRALYGSGEARSRAFEISRKVHVNVILDPPVVNPGEKVNVSGIIIKDNRELMDGFVVISLEGIQMELPVFSETSSEELNESAGNETSEENITEEEPVEEVVENANNFSSGTFSREVKEGRFSGFFSIPEDTPPGNYKFSARAFDMDRNGNLLNEGESYGTIRVKQVVKDVDVAFSSNTIAPGNEFVYRAIVYDQAGNEGQGDVGVEIRKPDKSLFFGKLIAAGETNSLFIEHNATPGYWEVSAEIESFEKTKLFYVEELQKIESSIAQGILTIKNAGNVPYEKQIEISIGGKSEVRRVELEIGGSTQFKLGAPDGEYEITIKDGNITQSLGSTFLTGRAIGIDNIEGTLFGKFGVWIWALVIAILLIVTLILLRKTIKKRFVGKMPVTISSSGKIEQYTNKFVKKESSPVQSAIPAISNIIDSGTKEEAAVIALKIKNLAELQNKGENNPLQEIEKALLSAKDAKAKIYVDGNYRIVIFTQSITKSKDNDIVAISVASEIVGILGDYNKISSQKIEFGVGVHSGRIAIETTDGKIKFVSLDNTMAVTKRVADYSSSSVLVSDTLYKKTLGKIKVDKIENSNYWELKRVIDRTYYEEFIQKFLNRQRTK